MPLSPTVGLDADQMVSFFLILSTSIGLALASILALLCCCHQPAVEKSDKRGDESQVGCTNGHPAAEPLLHNHEVNRNAAAMPPEIHCHQPQTDRVEQRHMQPAHAATVAVSLRGELREPGSGVKIAVAAHTVESEDMVQKNLTVVQKEAARLGPFSDNEKRDFATIRGAGVNVRSALSIFEVDQNAENHSPEPLKAAIRPARKKLEVCFDEQMIMKQWQGKPTIQRHTIAAESFALHEGSSPEPDRESAVSVKPVKVLPEAAASNLKSNQKYAPVPHPKPEKQQMSDNHLTLPFEVQTEGDNVACETSDEDDKDDYFSIVQRNDVVLRTVDKLKAPHKHKKGKVPGVKIDRPDGLDSTDAQPPQTLSSGDLRKKDSPSNNNGSILQSVQLGGQLTKESVLLDNSAL